jgi:hypothetical protein
MMSIEGCGLGAPIHSGVTRNRNVIKHGGAQGHKGVSRIFEEVLGLFSQNLLKLKKFSKNEQDLTPKFPLAGHHY